MALPAFGDTIQERKQNIDEADQTPERLSFWLLSDNSIDLGINPLRLSSFIAHLKHALLFHQRLLLSDSLVVNTPNLRRAIQRGRVRRGRKA